MTSVDPRHRLASLLRSEVPVFRARRAAERPPTHAGHAARTSRGRDAASVAAQRIQALSPEDADREKKAVRIFLESVLLQEFGAHLVHDQSFSEMVDAVQQQMQGDAQLAAAANELGGLLVAATGGS